MIEKFLKFHKKELTLWGLMDSGYKILCCCFFGFTIICIIGALAQQLLFAEHKYWWWLPALVSIISTILCLLYVSCRIKRKYKIENYSVYFSNKFKEFLRKQNYVKVEDKIIGLLEYEAKKIKDDFFFYYGVISGLYLIVFSCFCHKYYSISQTDTDIIITTVILGIMVFILYLIVRLVKEISETRYSAINRMIIMLKENQIQREIDM